MRSSPLPATTPCSLSKILTTKMSSSYTCEWAQPQTTLSDIQFHSFIFTLQEFSKELIFLVDAIERIYCYEQHMLRRNAWWFRLAVWIHKALSNLDFSRKKSPDGRKRTLNIRSSLGTVSRTLFYASNNIKRDLSSVHDPTSQENASGFP